jgi:hypothetical protein
MIEVKISEIQIETARGMLLSRPLKNSITNGRSEIYGKLGEVIVKDYCDQITESSYNSTYDFDLIIGGLKAEVKTKRTTVIPQPHYNCSVSGFNTSQDCDIYVFVRILEDMTSGYILGFLPRKKFYDLATFGEKGGLDDGFSFKSDTYNVTVSQLRMFKKIS